MAGRIRSIKPELLEDGKTARLGHLEWRLFVSMIVIADDHGNLRGDPDYVRSTALWASRESAATVAKALETLARLSLVVPYRAREQDYLHISGWEKHQKVDHPSKPRMPTLADAERSPLLLVSGGSRDPRETLGQLLETLAPDLRPPTSDPDPDVPLRFDPAAAIAQAAVSEINRLSNSNYKPTTAGTVKLARSLASLGHTPEQVIAVVRSKKAWLDDGKMAEHFCPATLLAAKNFAKYLEALEAGPTPRGAVVCSLGDTEWPNLDGVMTAGGP